MSGLFFAKEKTMNKRIFRIASLLLVTTLLISVFAVGSFALEWDGDSVGGGGNGTDAGKVGYAIRTLGDNVIGYRFSLVDIYGNNKVSKVIDVFQDRYHGNNGYNSLYKFVPKCNKRQLIDSQDGAFTTENNKINCYKEADMGFATALPSPDGMGEWQNNITNLNKVLNTLGAGSIDTLDLGDKLLVEPIYDIRLESVWHAITVTEVAVYGKHLFGGSSNGGPSNGSESFGFIASYTNKYYANELFTPDGQGLWPGATPTSKRLTFQKLIDYGYGVGIAYTQEVGSKEPILDVDLCQAWPGEPEDYTQMYGFSVGPTFDYWSYENGYPIMGKNVWFDIRFPREDQNYYVRQTVTIDGQTTTSRDIWSDSGVWYRACPDPLTVAAGKESYIIKARVDWIDENGEVRKYGMERTFYIPVRPKLHRYQVIAYSSTGAQQAYSGMAGAGGAVYYGQRIYTQYQYTADSTWTSYNNLYATMQHWDGSSWVPTNGGPDGTALRASMVAGTVRTVTSDLRFVTVPNNAGSGRNVIPFTMTTAWVTDPEHTEETSQYEIPILIADVAVSEIYLVNKNNVRLDPAKLTAGETVYVRYVYRNNTGCTVYVDGFNTNREQINSNSVYSIPANGTITVDGGSLVVPSGAFSVWGGVYLEGAGIYNTEYESNGNNNQMTLNCNANYPLSLTPIDPNAPYREGTTVITSYWLNNHGNANVTPSSNIAIRFKVYKADGTLIATQTATQVIVPGNHMNLYYFKWTVPNGLSTSGVQVVAEIIDGGSTYGTVTRNYSTCGYPIYDTPDTDYSAKAPDGFSVPAMPNADSNYAVWWQWEWRNNAFVKEYYGIGIAKQSSDSLVPDTNSNSTQSGGSWIMKSGYGVWLDGTNELCYVSGYTAPTTNAYTAPQFGYAAYPEFGYQYGANLCTTLLLKNGHWYFSNPASPKYHYTPIYFPDGQYVVKIVKSDMWTPAGMISAVSTTKPITIKDSAYDDWFVGWE
jgi:hypothetical protein